MRCGLLGRKLSHSFSPQIHRMLGNYSYELFEKEPEELASFLESGCWDGLNVTVPYKKAVIPYLDQLTPIAEKLGAVNTVVRRDGKLIGHNTDYFGFLSMVKASGLDISGKKALVLGSGGASCTAAAVLEELGAKVLVISRSGENNYGNIHLHRDAAVLVNTTPVGMYPHTGEAPLSLALLPHLEGVLDVIYNPARTRLLQEAAHRGIVTVNGLLMLAAQAKEAAEWFSGQVISDAVITDIYRTVKLQSENIILIGMPGCGKSTVGPVLAKACAKTFVDSDEWIVKYTGKTIPEIFAQYGQSHFRQLETKALAELGKQSGLVIATGGGCVTEDRNYPLLRQNGTIFWIKRSLSELPTHGRPLSQQYPPEEIYRIRRPLYEAFADCSIDNNGSPDEAAGKILAQLEELS